MYVNKQLTDENLTIHQNKQGIYYTEIIPTYYALAIKDKDGTWQYSLKIWRWDIDMLYVERHITCSSTERFTDHREAIKTAVTLYRRLNGNRHA